ncbi:MAG: asparaginase [Zetaproteobacteria bacterium]|nr:asparaginase [Zetaproteobacteria bacterium]
MNPPDQFKPIFGLKRGPSIDFLVFAQYLVYQQGHTLSNSSEFQVLCRSLLNPWQFLAAGIVEEDPFWAMGLSLHSGQPIHIQALEEISRRYHISEEELICPRDFPLHWETAARLRLQGTRPRRLHHPNAGKHMLFLASCAHHDYDRHSYWSPSHPIQKKLFSIVGKEVKSPIQSVTDHCGLPTFYMSASQLCQMWQNLALSQQPNVHALKQLWLRNPLLIGGSGRLDHELTSVCSGHALVKEGADGLLLLQTITAKDEPQTTILIKLASGFHKTHLGLALKTILDKMPGKPEVLLQLCQYLAQKSQDWMDSSTQCIPFI